MSVKASSFRITKVIYAENIHLYAKWREKYISMRNVANPSSVITMNEGAIGGTGGVWSMYWQNCTEKSANLHIFVRAKRINIIDGYYNITVNVNGDNNPFSGVIFDVTVPDNGSYMTKEVDVTVPNGYYLRLGNNNDAYSVWTITYN